MFKSLAKSHHFPEIITTCEIHAAWFYFQSWKQKKSPPKKQKIKNCRHRKKSESLFLELSLEGHCLDRPLWRHCGGGCLIGDCCSRLWGSDRGAATRATEEPPTERGATGPSPRTLWAPRTQRCPSLSPTLGDLVNHLLSALRLVYFLHLIRPCDMRGGFQNCSHQSHKRMF